jgi:hypothetical protein
MRIIAKKKTKKAFTKQHSLENSMGNFLIKVNKEIIFK